MLGVTLALVSTNGGADTPPAQPLLGENVGLRVSAGEPARSLAPMLRRFASASRSPAVRRAVRRTSAALGRTGERPTRDLLGSLSSLAISLERSCPPPALLACRPAVRITGRLSRPPAPDLRQTLPMGLRTALRASGFRSMAIRSAASGPVAGRITSRGETLARWRLARGVLELATGGLALSARPRAPQERAGASPVVEVDRAVLARLF